MIRVQTNHYLKSAVRKKDGKRQLMITTRVYNKSVVTDRFNYYPKDGANSVFETNLNYISIRTQELIKYVTNIIDKEVKTELSRKHTLDVPVLVKNVDDIVKSTFNQHYANILNAEWQTIDKVVDGTGHTVAMLKNPVQVSQSVLNNLDTLQIELPIDEDDVETILNAEQRAFESETEKQLNDGLSTEMKYKKGAYNHEDIFEVFGSIKYSNEFPDTYKKIVLRLFQYKTFGNPSHLVKDFNENWLLDFYQYLWTSGYFNTREQFDVLNFNQDIFKGKQVEKYSNDYMWKFSDILKTVAIELAKQKRLPIIAFPDVETITDEPRPSKGKRLEHNLSNNEFNALVNLKFDKSKMDEYNKIFKSFFRPEKSHTTNATIELLDNARDLFVLQVMTGGLRGYDEAYSIKFDKINELVTINSNKIDRMFINPFNCYTKKLAEKYDYKLPAIPVKNSDGVKKEIYRATLKTIAHILDFNRPVIDNNKPVEVKSLFNAYFARKTFSQIMYDEYEFTVEEIAMFTQHEINKSVLTTNYVNTKSLERKRKLFAKIKCK